MIVMASQIVDDLLKRRVPQILGVYLAVGWGTLEFTDWLIGRYGLAPRIADVSLAVWVLMIPTVGLLAYFHGERGVQRWTRAEQIGIPTNLLVLTGVLIFMFRETGGANFASASVEAAALDPTRIAVMYFDDDSEAQDLGHLASAFTGALIDELTQVKALDVIPRAGVKPYRGTSVRLDSIVRALSTGTVVEGSVSGSRERLSVSVALVDPGTQTTLEGFTLEGALEEWLDLRDKLAKEVARTLRRRLGVEVKLRERQAGANSSEALALVEKAERLMAEAEELEAAGATEAAARELARADSALELSEGLDPSWPEPILLRGWVAWRRSIQSRLAPGEFDQGEANKSLDHIARVLELAPGHAGALELRGVIRSYMSENPQLVDPSEMRRLAEEDLRAAVAADPYRAQAWNALSALHQSDAQFAEARRDAERALEADPFLDEAHVVIWRLYESSQELMDMEEAVRWCEEGHRRYPEKDYFVSCSLFTLALSEGPEATPEKAWSLAEESLQLSSPEQRAPLRPVMESWVAAALARAGLADSAKAVAERARGAASSDLRPWLDYYAANVHLLLRERKQTLDLLAAFLEKIPQRRDYLASDWMFRDLWEDPGFKALVAANPSDPR